jgi:hypothetical protein
MNKEVPSYSLFGSSLFGGLGNGSPFGPGHKPGTKYENATPPSASQDPESIYGDYGFLPRQPFDFPMGGGSMGGTPYNFGYGNSYSNSYGRPPFMGGGFGGGMPGGYGLGRLGGGFGGGGFGGYGGMGGLGNILRTLGSLFGGSMGGGMMPSFGGGGMMPSFGRGLGGLFQQAPQADRPPRTNRPEVEELSDMTPMEQPDRPPRTNRPEVNSTRDILARAAMSPMEQPASRGGFLNPRPLPDNARMLRPRFGNGFGGGLGSMFSRF